MKKLRFLGIVVGVMVWFGMFEIRFVDAATCSGVQEYFIDEEYRSGAMGSGTVVRSPRSGEIYTLGSDSGGVCGVKETNTLGMKNYIATLQTCTIDGTIREIECLSNELCSRDNGVMNAKCGNVGYCVYDQENNGYYGIFGRHSDLNVPMNFTFDEEEACFGKVRKQCHVKTGQWSVIEECLQSCVMHKGVAMSTVCESDCTNPDGINGDAYCIENKDNNTSKVMSCYQEKWNEKTPAEFFDNSECLGCRQTGNGPECYRKVYNADGTYNYGIFCSEIKLSDGTVEPANLQSEGNYICRKSEPSKLYQCKSDGFYYESLDCSSNTDGRTFCGTDGEKVGCVDKTTVITTDQTVANSSVIIEVETDEGFLCTKNGQDGIDTALGCIPYSMSGLAGALLPLLFGIAGGISFLLMVFGFIMVATSSGDEKKLIEARGRITSAITGLLVSIFAIFLFRLIFSNILKIPGL